MIPAKGMGPKIEQAGWSKEGQGFLDRHRDTIAMTQQQEECTKKREYRAQECDDSRRNCPLVPFQEP
jgi:hypothetical protein